MGDQLEELTENGFADAIAQGVTLVDFWAPWCGPCRMQGPICEAVAAKVGDKAKVAKLNVDDAPKVAAKYMVQSIPTMIIFKDGEIASQFVGMRKEEDLVAAIEEAQ